MQQSDKTICQKCGGNTDGYTGRSRYKNISAICAGCSLWEMIEALHEWGIYKHAVQHKNILKH